MEETKFLKQLRFVAGDVNGDQLDSDSFYRMFIDVYMKPLCGNLTKNYPLFVYGIPSNPDARGQYHPYFNEITLNVMNMMKIIEDIDCGMISNNQVFNYRLKGYLRDLATIVHEWRHFTQAELAKYVYMHNGDLKNPVFNFEQTQKIIEYFTKYHKNGKHENENAIRKELEFIYEVSGTPTSSRDFTIIDSIAYGQYLKRTIEEDSRDYAIDFLAAFIEYLKNHKLMQDACGMRIISALEEVRTELLERESYNKIDSLKAQIHDEKLQMSLLDKKQSFKDFSSIVQNLIKELQIKNDFDNNAESHDKLARVIYLKEVFEQVVESCIDKVMIGKTYDEKILLLKDIYCTLVVDGEPWAVESLRKYVINNFQGDAVTRYFDISNTENIFEELLRKKVPINHRTFSCVNFDKTFPIDEFIDKGQTRYAQQLIYRLNERKDKEERLAQTLISVKDRVEILKHNFKNKSLIFDDVYDLLILMDTIRMICDMPAIEEVYFGMGDVGKTTDFESMINMNNKQVLETMYKSIVIDLEKLSYDYVVEQRKLQGLPMHSINKFRFGNFEDKQKYLLAEKKEKERYFAIYGEYESKINENEQQIYDSIPDPKEKK